MGCGSSSSKPSEVSDEVADAALTANTTTQKRGSVKNSQPSGSQGAPSHNSSKNSSLANWMSGGNGSMWGDDLNGIIGQTPYLETPVESPRRVTKRVRKTQQQSDSWAAPTDFRELLYSANDMMGDIAEEDETKGLHSYMSTGEMKADPEAFADSLCDEMINYAIRTVTKKHAAQAAARRNKRTSMNMFNRDKQSNPLAQVGQR